MSCHLSSQHRLVHANLVVSLLRFLDDRSMDVVTGAVASVITKLSDLLAGEYNLQMGMKGEIQFLQAELWSMKGALEKLSNTPVDQLDIQDKIWAKDLRELSYDIEDSIDTFMVCGSDHESTKLYGIRKFIDKSVGFFKKAKVHHGIATEIEDIKSRVVEVHKRRRRYEVSHGVYKAATTIMDPRLFSQYSEIKELVGIDETIDELVKILMGDNGVPFQQGKILSIAGFGGLGKTTLATAVYEKIGALFDCYAFVSVSQAPDLKKLFKGLLYDLGNNINEEIVEERRFINILRDFLAPKRYFIVIDDIWDISVWKAIKCALPDNDVGYAIITTTRNSDVAEKTGGAYKLKPLSQNNSRKLLCGRILANENNGQTEKYLDEELAEVCDRILKKCAGVPLAIITVASLLACTARNKMDWYEVYNAIGTGLENSLDVENMRKILSFSYYNMPSRMRSCLLYLSVFPEDYRIRKDRLIWMWIVEGFIQCDKRGKSLFEVGESYFNELINRSMIQTRYDVDGTVYECHVHDMVLDLLRSLSSEENFITILNGLDHKSPPSMIRRLSLHGGKDDGTTTPAATAMRFQQVRSLVAFTAAATLKPVLTTVRNFQVLRVLELQDCDLSQGYSLEYVGNLFHLRYLGLRGTHIAHLPEEIGKLQFLQILDVQRNNISCLPSTIVQLRHLIGLYSDDSTRVPNGIGSLTSLEVLSELAIDDSNMGILEDLGQLTELRVLKIVLIEWDDKLVGCLNKLQKIQDLSVWAYGGLDGWVAPRHLRLLKTQGGCWLSTLSSWMNHPSSLLPDLSSLSILVREFRQADLDILGWLPSLRYLNLEVDHESVGSVVGGLVVGASSFSCLMQCRFWNFLVPVAFQQGSMSRLQTLKLQFSVRELIRANASGNGSLDLGVENLPSLQHVNVHFDSEGASNEEVEQLEAGLRHAIEIHPNHPQLYIQNCR